jgi:hypothetical protein
MCCELAFNGGSEIVLLMVDHYFNNITVANKLSQINQSQIVNLHISFPDFIN